MTENQQTPVRIGLISLGCAKNLVDAEIMLGALAKDGMEITNDASLADVVIVNTCAFIDSAQEESIDAILESDQVRAVSDRRQGLIVAGCLPQRFKESLPELMPEVDAFIGIDQVPQITGLVRQALAHREQRLRHLDAAGANGKSAKSGQRRRKALDLPTTSPAPDSDPEVQPIVQVNSRPVYIPDYETPRFRLTPRHFAYLKIAEGCNHPCSFCTIPRIRGGHRSRQEEDIVKEAADLIAGGVKEINLISQDTTYYGLDFRRNGGGAASAQARVPSTHLCSLLRRLNELEGDFWIRLLYTHPAHWTDPLIETIASCPKVARYVDMPLQHIDGVMLERMRRETTPEHIEQLIAKMRAGIPGIALRTTFIVGFPGETEARFERLLEFIRATRFERLGIFTYSREDGTRAGRMTGQIAQAEKLRRRESAMEVQREVARSVAQSFLGRTLRVLVEHPANPADLKAELKLSAEHGQVRAGGTIPIKGRQLWVSRGEADAPDIDGRVYIRQNHHPLAEGQFVSVQVINHTDYDLVAEPV